MKVFISFSYKNKEFATKLKRQLEKNDIDVWIHSESLSVGEDITKSIKKALSEIDYFIIILSKDSVQSDWVNFELSATLVNETQLERNIVVPVLYEDCEIPNSIRDRFYVDFSKVPFEKAFEKLISDLKKLSKSKIKTAPVQNISGDYDTSLKTLKRAYQKGKLTLFCGAGISIEAGVPTWNKLLKLLIKEVYLNNPNVSIDNVDTKLADIFQNQKNLSSIIIGKYLKMLLGNNFLQTTRKILYESCNGEGKIIDAISELSRPKRGMSALNSIVTFNFDDLIEEKFKKEKISYKAIYKEGDRPDASQIPVYHPHGFLPRKIKLTEDHNIVFSEDTYHNQFTDAYSWSNLVQLNHLNNNTCLFVGISLTDPNMRRILDVTAKKSRYQERNHFIIKKRYNKSDLFHETENSQEEDAIIRVVESIEETDSNKLGFNVIWVNEFSEISNVLSQIGKL